MKYVYYMNKNNTGNKIVSLKELKNELNKVCVSTTYVNDWLSIESTDLKKVDKVLRTIRKGQHYIICTDDGSLCCHATKGGDE